VETVFRALADPTRRALLDALFTRDGQTLVALTSGHDMTRIAVAKHLRLLEEAGLVVSRRQGREKLHYLNPVPIRLIHDRWVSKYTEPWAAGLAGLKQELERPMEKVFEIYIRTTPELLWEAITDPAIRAKYHFGASVDSEWTQGSRYELNHPGSDGPLPRVRTWLWIRPVDLCRLCTSCGARMPSARAPHASPGRSNPSETPAA
jgi:DNA-binding transcriptional ArsR family regulator